MLGVRDYVELKIPDAVTTVDSLQGDGVVAAFAENVACAEFVRQYAVTNGNQRVAVVSRMDVEVQTDEAVAVVEGRVVDLVNISLPILLTIPEERQIHVANIDGGVCCEGRVDGQMQRGDAVATVHGLEVEDRGGERRRANREDRITVSVRQLAVADGDIIIRGNEVVNRQVQGDRGVATVDVGEDLVIFTSGSIGGIIPRVRIASGGRELVELSVIDRQVHGDGAVAAVPVGEHLRIITRSGIYSIIPGKAVTNNRVESGSFGVIHCQMQGDGGVTTVPVGEMLNVIIRNRINRIVPSETVANRSVESEGFGVIDRQVQGDGGVAAVPVGEMLNVIIGNRINRIIPGETIANRSVYDRSFSVVDGQVQGDHTVAAGSVDEGVRERVAGGGDAGVLVPVEAVASHSGGVASVAMTHGEVQSDHTVATNSIGESMCELTAFGNVRVVVPVETVTSKGCGVANAGRQDGQM